MTTKHTPGPHSVKFWSDERMVDGGRYVVCAANGAGIAEMMTCGHNAKALANATLYAQSPRLLAALKAMVCMCEGESGTGASFWETVPEYCEAVRAIAAAEGRE